MLSLSSIAPGAFASEMNKVARDETEKNAKVVPAKRIGREEDMAGAAMLFIWPLELEIMLWVRQLSLMEVLALFIKIFVNVTGF